MFIWDTLMNETCKHKTAQKRMNRKGERQEQIIIHETVESLDKHKQQFN